MYKCPACGKKIELDPEFERVRCKCGHRVLFKDRGENPTYVKAI